MAEKLVIVESPSKAKTIQKYLGKGYEVLSSQGHVRDLPQSKFGVKTEGKFVPEFEILKGKEKIVKQLKDKSKGKEVLLATDNDREGEAIAWHLAQILKVPVNGENRIVFNEITEKVIKNSVKAPRKIDKNMVNSQLTRRILDRIVGYKVSPILWKNFKYGLSAGRVQSAALKILSEQERKVQGFKPEVYYELLAELFGMKTKLKTFDGNDLSKKPFNDEKLALEALDLVKSSEFAVRDIKNSKTTTKAPLPFKTSTMQQAASSELGFPVSRTMKIAQKLYEGVDIDGETIALITYMRTDSYRISEVAKNKAKELITENYGAEYLRKSRAVKNDTRAQDAHEAIRPTYPEFQPDSLKGKISKELHSLYSLIWKRFMASQMVDSTYEKRTLTVSDEKERAAFVVEFKKRIFDGFEKVMASNQETKVFPDVKKGQKVKVVDPVVKEQMTTPPPRYTEATLVKKLETAGVGRPSTYAAIIQTLLDRKYVERDRRTLVPTFLGMMVNDFLTKEFSRIVDLKFTALMEDELDSVESGKSDWQNVLKGFDGDFEENLERVLKDVKDGKHRVLIPSDIECPKGDDIMQLKYGRYGAYLECPKCGEKMSIPSGSKINFDGKSVHIEIAKPEMLDEKCPKCGAPLVKRIGRYGPFISCSRYPDCDYSKPFEKETRGHCPKCGGRVFERKSKKGKHFFICENNPEKCDYISWYEPSDFKCETDGEVLHYKKIKGEEVLFCQKCKKEYEVSDFEKD